LQAQVLQLSGKKCKINIMKKIFILLAAILVVAPLTGCRERHVETESEVIAGQVTKEIDMLKKIKITGSDEERTSLAQVEAVYGEPTSKEATDHFVYHYDMKTIGLTITIGFDAADRAMSYIYEKKQIAGDPISRKTFHAFKLGEEMSEEKAAKVLGPPTRVAVLGQNEQTSLTWIYNDKDEHGKNRSFLMIIKDGKLNEVAPADYLY
jgi:hypothetical protein